LWPGRCPWARMRPFLLAGARRFFVSGRRAGRWFIDVMRHLLGIAHLDPGTIEPIFPDADHIIDGASRLATARAPHLLTLFFEHSTRTMQSFHTAARRLGMHVADLPISRSSVEKGESFADTLLTVKSLNFDVVVIRHPLTGAA